MIIECGIHGERTPSHQMKRVFVIEDSEDAEEEDAVPLEEDRPAVDNDTSRCTSDEERQLLTMQPQSVWMCCCGKSRRGCVLM